MAHQNRRRFLEDSMLAAAAAATTGQVALGEEQSKSPNDKLSVAVVGVRGRGNSHIGAFAGRTDTEVTYICDPDSSVGEKRADEVAKRQGGRKPTYVSDIRKVLEDKSVDIVTIATPNHWHALAAIWAIQAGKDVYVEKPVSHNVSEGRRIVQAARKYEKICQTGTQSRSNPGMIEAIKYVHEGEIGKVTVGRGLCFKRRGSIGAKGQYDPPASVDYDLWLGPAPMAPLTRQQFHYDWHWQFPYGNGDLGNQGIHQMDLARWGLGVNELSQGVISYGGRFGYSDAGDVPNSQVVMHDYGDKTLTFEVRGLNSAAYRGAKIGVIFEGSEGYVVMTSYSSGAAFDPEGKMVRKFSGGGNHFENFLKAVRSRKSTDLNADILEGHLSSALCHLGNISYRLGDQLSPGAALERLQDVRSNDNVKETLDRFAAHLARNKVKVSNERITMGAALSLDPKAETFLDNNQADQMLTREYRVPFVVPESV